MSGIKRKSVREGKGYRNGRGKEKKKWFVGCSVGGGDESLRVGERREVELTRTRLKERWERPMPNAGPPVQSTRCSLVRVELPRSQTRIHICIFIYMLP